MPILSRSLVQPLMLEPARVHRVYRGGALLERWLGLPQPADGMQPEAWFGAVNAARNTGGPPVAQEGVGVALVPPDWRIGGADDQGRVRIPALLAAYPEAMLGGAHLRAYGATTAILFKVLDSAMRLTVQAHPDRAFALERFRSPFGKEECWVVLGTRSLDATPPHLYLGFREQISAADLQHWVAGGDMAAILAAMRRIAVQPGDVYYVPAGTPHAIGPGLLIAEVQEPTDFTISFDREFAGATLPEERRFLGLPMAEALAAVHLTPFSDWSLTHLHRASNAGAVQMSDGRAAGTQVTRPVGDGSQDRFWIELLTVGPDDELLHAPFGTIAIGIVAGGSGTLSGANGRELAIRQGQGFLLPATLGEWSATSGGIGLRMIVCGPQPAAMTAAP